MLLFDKQSRDILEIIKNQINEEYGFHDDKQYLDKFVIDDMYEYDEVLLEKWSYRLYRTYLSYCPKFDKIK